MTLLHTFTAVVLALVMLSGCALTYNKRDVVVTKVTAGETCVVKLGGFNFR